MQVAASFIPRPLPSISRMVCSVASDNKLDSGRILPSISRMVCSVVSDNKLDSGRILPSISRMVCTAASANKLGSGFQFQRVGHKHPRCLLTAIDICYTNWFISMDTAPMVPIR